MRFSREKCMILVVVVLSVYIVWWIFAFLYPVARLEGEVFSGYVSLGRYELYFYGDTRVFNENFDFSRIVFTGMIVNRALMLFVSGLGFLYLVGKYRNVVVISELLFATALNEIVVISLIKLVIERIRVELMHLSGNYTITTSAGVIELGRVELVKTFLWSYYYDWWFLSVVFAFVVFVFVVVRKCLVESL